MAEVKWIKIVTDIFNNRKIKQIESMPEGDAIIVIWFKILCLAGIINDSGEIYLTNELPYTDQMLSTQFNKPIQVIQLALRTFEQFGMIKIIDNIIHVSQWEKYQNTETLDKIREQTRMRVAKHREAKKIESNVTVTLRNATEEDKEEDIDKDKEKDKDILNTKEASKKIYYPDEKLNQTFLEYIEMRKKIKRPMTDHAIDLAMRRLKELSTLPFSDDMDNDLAIKILEQSILSDYQGLFPLKENGKGGNKQENGFEYLARQIREGGTND